MATPRRGNKSGAKKGGSGKSTSSKVGLIFPVGRVGSLLRGGRYAKRVGVSAAVYLTAVLEYLTGELLDLTSKVVAASKKNKSKRITPRALTLAVRNDAGLGSLLKDVTLSRGGVVPNLHKVLEGKKGKGSKKGKKSTQAV